MSEVRIVARACVILTYSTGWRERAARKTKKERNREFGVGCMGVKKVWLGFKRGLGSGIVQALEVLQVLNTPNIGQHRALPPKRSAEKRCILSDRSKGSRGSSPSVRKALGDELKCFFWIDSPIRFLPNLSFVFIAYFICAHLRGASFGTKLSGGT
jgi:hypothetical protein